MFKFWDQDWKNSMCKFTPYVVLWANRMYIMCIFECIEFPYRMYICWKIFLLNFWCFNSFTLNICYCSCKEIKKRNELQIQYRTKSPYFWNNSFSCLQAKNMFPRLIPKMYFYDWGYQDSFKLFNLFFLQ